MTKFNVGDKVRIVRKTAEDCALSAKVGDIVRITGKYDGVYYPIEYNGGISGYITRGSIEPVKEAYKTEKRKARVGERILITNAETSLGYYKNGDVFTVKDADFCGGIDVVQDGEMPYIDHAEYEVIVAYSDTDRRLTEAEAKIKTLETEVKALKTAQKPSTIVVNSCEARVSADVAADRIATAPVKVMKAEQHSPNQRRADVIKRAQEFVAGQKRTVSGIVANGLPAEGKHVEIGDVYSTVFNGNRTASKAVFIVNADKRAVTVLLKGVVSDKLHAKGVAKCAPDDVFNADIGKAIALGRALGVKVPAEFYNAPQPESVVVGMIVQPKPKSPYTSDPYKVVSIVNAELHDVPGRGYITAEYAIITDDTDAVYS